MAGLTDNAMRLVLLGPPGAGKGTQAEAIVGERGIPHISTGEILREAVANGTEVGLKAKSYMDAGDLVPDDVVVAIVAERLRAPDCSNGWLLDGFPRNLVQAEALGKATAEMGTPISMVLYLNIAPETAVERISGRRLCADCGAGFHVSFMPPKAEGVCDKCGGKLYQRDDDSEETVRARLATYDEQTVELIEHYRSAGLLVEIRGDENPENVAEQVLEAVRGIRC